MKKIINHLLVLSLSVLLSTVLLALLTLATAFNFEEYNVFGWILFSFYYIAAICIGYKIAEAEDMEL